MPAPARRGRASPLRQAPPWAARRRIPPRAARCSVRALDDAEVALGAVAERLEGGLVVGRFVRGERLVHVVELDDDHALLHSQLVGLGRIAADDEAAAGLLDRG